MSSNKFLFYVVCVVCIYLVGERFYYSYFAPIESEESYYRPEPTIEYVPQRLPTSVIMDRQIEEEPRLAPWKQADLTPFHAIDGTFDFLATDEVNTVWLVRHRQGAPAYATLMSSLRMGYFKSTSARYVDGEVAHYLKGVWNDSVPRTTIVAISHNTGGANVYAPNRPIIKISTEELQSSARLPRMSDSRVSLPARNTRVVLRAVVVLGGVSFMSCARNCSLQRVLSQSGYFCRY